MESELLSKTKIGPTHTPLPYRDESRDVIWRAMSCSACVYVRFAPRVSSSSTAGQPRVRRVAPSKTHAEASTQGPRSSPRT